MSDAAAMGRLGLRVERMRVGAGPSLAQRARELEALGHDVLSLSSDDPDFAIPARVLEAYRAALDRADTRPTPPSGLAELRRAVAERQGRDGGPSYEPSEVLISAGSRQSLFNAICAIVDPGDEVILLAPYWLAYRELVLFAGATPVIVQGDPSRGFAVDPAALAAALGPRTRMVILNSPANPTGRVYGEEELLGLLSVLETRPEIHLLFDETYRDFVYGDRRFVSPHSLPPRSVHWRARALIIGGCCKSYAMSGLPVGWALGPESLIAAMTRVQALATSSPSAPAQHAAIAALTGEAESLRGNLATFDVRRRFVEARLSLLRGADTAIEVRGGYYLLLDVSAWIGRRAPSGERIRDDASLSAYLLRAHHLLLVPGAPYGAPSYVRLSFAAPLGDLARGLERLERALAELR